MFDHTSRANAVYDVASAKWHTYAELAEEVYRVAETLHAPAKSLVFCFCRNDYQCLCGYLAGLEAGHASALLDDGTAASFQTSLIDLYRPNFIVHSSAAEIQGTNGEYQLMDTRGPCVWRRKSAPDTVIHNSLALLLSTSGSTGTPKFVRLSLDNLLANARSIVDGLSIHPGDRAITSLPFHYSYGLSIINTHLLTGASLVLTNEGLTSRAFWNTVRDLECSSFAGVPYSYQILHRLGLPGSDFPSLRTMTQAGGRLENGLVDQFFRNMAARGGRFFVMYGQTEATARIAILDPKWLPEKLGSAGRPISGGAIRIHGDSGPLAPGAVGELVYSGPNVMLGYAVNRSELSAGDDLKGTLHTGDLGSLDRDGFVYISGRLNRYAKLSGIRLNLDELEAMLKDHGPSAAVGIEDKLVIFCEGLQETALSHCRDELARRLSIHHRLLDFRVIPKLPLKANGKIDYTLLEQTARC